MRDCENPPEEPLKNETSFPLEEKTAFLRVLSGTGGPHEIKPGGHKWLLARVVHQCKKYKRSFADGDSLTTKDIVILAVLAVLLVISLGFNGYQAARQVCLRATLSQLNIISCPQNWTGNQQQRRCYFFSKTEGTWDFSLEKCSSYNASLVKMDSQQELDFAMYTKGSSEYWIGLRRESVGQAWKWPNGTLFRNLFPTGGEGPCAYLHRDVVRSATCTEERHWICSRSAKAV